jgi:outer membrane protein assembly factor BamB
VQWTFGTGGAIVAKPLVTDDHIVIGSLDGSIYALNRDQGA